MMLARFGCAALLACASLSGAALAAPVEEPGRVEVRYADLDLTTPAGVRMLNKRINAAASKVCVDLNGHGGEKLAAVMQCRRMAKGRATTAVEVAINDAKSGRRLAQNMISLSDR